MIKRKEIEIYDNVEAFTNGFRDMLSICCVFCFCEDGYRSSLNVRIFKVC